jgi:hypothetical protein
MGVVPVGKNPIGHDRTPAHFSFAAGSSIDHPGVLSKTLSENR